MTTNADRLTMMARLMVEHMIDSDARYIMVTRQRSIPSMMHFFASVRLDDDNLPREVSTVKQRIKVGNGALYFVAEGHNPAFIKGLASGHRAIIVFDPHLPPKVMFTEQPDLSDPKFAPPKKDEEREAYRQMEIEAAQQED
jgi:hypothetical protein